jgi:hypothetical protein
LEGAPKSVFGFYRLTLHANVNVGGKPKASRLQQRTKENDSPHPWMLRRKPCNGLTHALQPVAPFCLALSAPLRLTLTIVLPGRLDILGGQNPCHEAASCRDSILPTDWFR